MKNFLKFGKLSKYFSSRSARWILFIVLVVAIFFLNTLHESYPDEFDNILGGRLILQGILPYSGFFTHHGPIPYFIAAIIEIISGQSFVLFRIIYSFFLTLFLFLTYRFLRKRFGEQVRSYQGYIVVIGLWATYIWAHMFLADNLAGFIIVPAYIILILSSINAKPLTARDVIVISISSFLVLLSSLTYIYFILILYGFTLFTYFKDRKTHTPNKLALICLTLFLPFLVFGIYLILTHSFTDYFRQNIDYNTKYYIYNYPRPPGSEHINPVRFAVVIANDFYNSFTGLLLNAKDFNFSFPISAALAVANVALLIYLLSIRRFALAGFVLLIIIYTNARSNPLSSGDRDYQSAVYHFISLINLLFVLEWIYTQLNGRLESGKKLIYSGLFLVVGVYGFFSLLFVIRKFNDKVYGKYMGTAPLIYDRPTLAPIANRLTTSQDYVWIGPFEFEELFYTRGKIPSKYHILLPGMGKSQYMQAEILKDFTAHMPKIIMFDRRFFIYGSSPELYGEFFLNFLNQQYSTLEQYRRGNVHYMQSAQVSHRIDLETKLYIRKDQIEEVVDQLVNEKLVHPVSL